MKIDNFKVYDLAESIVASGLPMLAGYEPELFGKCVNELDPHALSGAHMNRACKLAQNAPGTGHNNFLSGVLVSANVTGTVKWWTQLQRYHFVQIVSSMSTMHRLREMLKNQADCFNGDTLSGAVRFIFRIGQDEHFSDEELVYSCPMGLELTARITTNYLQLKTIYRQRKSHKLQEWHEFCAWIESLPYAKEFITLEVKNETH